MSSPGRTANRTTSISNSNGPWENCHRTGFRGDGLTPDEKQVRSLSLRIISAVIRGPMDLPEHWIRSKNYERFFPREVPTEAAARRQYAIELLDRFATRAFRRPADAETVARLVELAEFCGRRGMGSLSKRGIAAGDDGGAGVVPVSVPRRDCRTSASPLACTPSSTNTPLGSRLVVFPRGRRCPTTKLIGLVQGSTTFQRALFSQWKPTARRTNGERIHPALHRPVAAGFATSSRWNINMGPPFRRAIKSRNPEVGDVGGTGFGSLLQ